MKAADVRKALRERPFRPFALRTVSGKRVLVRHPEFVLITPSGRDVFIVTEPGESEEQGDEWELLDMRYVEAIENVRPPGEDANGATQ